MAKEVAIGKRAKISEAQQYMLFSVVIAAALLGVAISLVSHFVKQISFNTEVIMAQEKSIASYSNLISSVGVCKKPSGDVYSQDELKKCTPDSIELAEIPDTLRSNILQKIAASEALNSVPKEDTSAGCLNASGKNYTYKELMDNYNDAKGKGEETLKAASQRIESCSALRVIPDALPAFKNEEALMASIDMLYRVSDWKPESLQSNQDSEPVDFGSNLNRSSINVTLASDMKQALRVLRNFERSIREIDITRANISWVSSESIELSAQASAYFEDVSTIEESEQTIKGDSKK